MHNSLTMFHLSLCLYINLAKSDKNTQQPSENNSKDLTVARSDCYTYLQRHVQVCSILHHYPIIL